MATWSEFQEAAPEIAQRGEKQLFQFGPGLAFLSTVRKDGGPRLHPVCVNLVDSQLALLIVPSPNQRDLLRDDRFALHSFPGPKSDDDFYLSGRAIRIADPVALERFEAAQPAGGATTSGDEAGFTLDIERALYSKYKPHGVPDNWPPTYLKWHSD
jgi:hypothetical protein